MCFLAPCSLYWRVGRDERGLRLSKRMSPEANRRTWESEGDLQESFLSFHRWGFVNQTKVVRLGMAFFHSLPLCDF